MNTKNHFYGAPDMKTFLKSFLLSCLFLGGLSSESAAQESGTLFMELERRLGALEETVQELTGRVEELQHALKVSGQEKSMTPETTGPSAQGEGGLPLVSQDVGGASGVPQASPFQKARGGNPSNGNHDTQLLPPEEAGNKKTQPKNEQEAYDQARKLVNLGQYEDAEKAFKDFIASYGKSPLVVNAQYWLGETYFERQDYKRSSVAFMEAYKIYRLQMKEGATMNRYAKAPESLIKLIASLKELGKKQQACVSYKHLRKEFPKLPSNLERLTQESVRGLPCQ